MDNIYEVTTFEYGAMRKYRVESYSITGAMQGFNEQIITGVKLVDTKNVEDRTSPVEG